MTLGGFGSGAEDEASGFGTVHGFPAGGVAGNDEGRREGFHLHPGSHFKKVNIPKDPEAAALVS